MKEKQFLFCSVLFLIALASHCMHAMEVPDPEQVQIRLVYFVSTKLQSLQQAHAIRDNPSSVIEEQVIEDVFIIIDKLQDSLINFFLYEISSKEAIEIYYLVLENEIDAVKEELYPYRIFWLSTFSDAMQVDLVLRTFESINELKGG